MGTRTPECGCHSAAVLLATLPCVCVNVRHCVHVLFANTPSPTRAIHCVSSYVSYEDTQWISRVGDGAVAGAAI